MYRIRVVLDTAEDVIRDIDISEYSSLAELHEQIVMAFELEKGELASFFASNESWEQGEEISLLDFGAHPGAEAKLMSDVGIIEYLKKRGSKMIYVYDLMKLWTFYVDLIQTNIPEMEEAQFIKIVGDRPKEAPSKSMESTNLDEDLEEEDYSNDEFQDEDPLDFNMN